MTFAPARAELARMYPRALPEWLDAMARLAPPLCAHYAVDRMRWVHLAGQIGWETRGLSLASMTENMRFTTAERILEVYSYRLGVALERDKSLARQHGSKRALARHLVGKPVELADIVYGGREGTPWMQGSLYIGRGPTQITHRDNYAAVMAEIRKQPGGAGCPDLVARPEVLADDPEMGIRSAFADFALKGLWRWCDADQCETVSDILNTGNAKDNVKPHGLDGRKRETARAKAIWSRDAAALTRGATVPPDGDADSSPADRPPAAVSVLREGSEGPDVAALQRALRAKGYPLGVDDGKWGTLTTRAVLAFQHEHGLTADGTVDWSEGSGFRQALETTSPADLGARSTITAKELRERGSTTARLAGRIGGVAKWIWRTMFGGAVAEASGVEVVDTVSSGADRVVALAGKFGGASAGGPGGKVVLVLIAIGVVGWLVARWAAEIESERVRKAATGADVSK